MAALRYLPLTRGFRARYGYSNLLYGAAGEIVARTSGKSWSEYVRARFLEPLGMRDALAAASEAGTITAWPHARITEEIRGAGPVVPLPRRYRVDGDGAAGALYASGSDMAKWMSVQLASGRLPDGRQLFSAGVAQDMHALQTPLRIRPSDGEFRAADPSFSGYGFGWFVRDYHGTKLVYHGGGTLGAVAQLTLVPQKNIGFIILTNSEESGFLRAAELLLLDHYLGRESPDWVGLQQAEDARMWRDARNEMKAAAAKLPHGPASLLRGLRAAARSAGALFIDDVVSALRREGDAWLVGLGRGEGISCSHVVNATGARAADVAQMAGVALPVRGQKRSVFVVDAPDADPAWPLVIDPDGFYFRPEGKTFLVGAPAPRGYHAADDFEPDYPVFEDWLWPKLAARAPAFERLKLQSAWAGHYEMNILDGNAVIGASGVPNFWLINGFSGHGLQHAPAAGRGLAELMLDGGYRTIDLRPLGFDRLRQAIDAPEAHII
ncbi:FAD-dependent oxidoreductase [Sphingopyxis sp.]|uniref:FAD-dependent oxidoreductase n=1 Tax=Sphingopyxis sp. TaxID=1908224 RepID=UPI002B4864F7|nr:FAD-dependent oxidoreductase [Sphingopyxis sp.]HJS12200.1 FAD-dependent oxidoreductase [Sphingopyxis sp.]